MNTEQNEKSFVCLINYNNIIIIIKHSNNIILIIEIIFDKTIIYSQCIWQWKLTETQNWKMILSSWSWINVKCCCCCLRKFFLIVFFVKNFFFLLHSIFQIRDEFLNLRWCGGGGGKLKTLKIINSLFTGISCKLANVSTLLPV